MLPPATSIMGLIDKINNIIDLYKHHSLYNELGIEYNALTPLMSVAPYLSLISGSFFLGKGGIKLATQPKDKEVHAKARREFAAGLGLTLASLLLPEILGNSLDPDLVECCFLLGGTIGAIKDVDK